MYAELLETPCHSGVLLRYMSTLRKCAFSLWGVFNATLWIIFLACAYCSLQSCWDTFKSLQLEILSAFHLFCFWTLPKTIVPTMASVWCLFLIAPVIWKQYNFTTVSGLMGFGGNCFGTPLHPKSLENENLRVVYTSISTEHNDFPAEEIKELKVKSLGSVKK